MKSPGINIKLTKTLDSLREDLFAHVSKRVLWVELRFIKQVPPRGPSLVDLLVRV